MMKLKNKYKTLVVFALTLFLSFGATSASGTDVSPNFNLPTLGTYESVGEFVTLDPDAEIALGDSSGEIELGDSDNEKTYSDILFQFKENGNIEDESLAVELTLTGDVANVKMTTTEEETIIEQENPANEDDYLIKDNLLFSSTDESEPVKIVPNLELGYSINIEEVESDKILETNSKVNFDLPKDGKYTFGLYDSENHWVANLLYDTRAENPGDISIDVIGGFDVTADNLQVTVDYFVPTSSEPQKLLLTTPPFYSLSGVPTAQAGVTYKNTVINFNPKHYENTTYGDKLIAYASTSPSYVRQGVLEVSLAPNVSGKISFTVTLLSNSTQKQNLSRAMVYFEENPDKIPLLIVAEAQKADGTIFNSATFEGNSLLTDASNNPVENKMSHPETDVKKVPSSYFRTMVPFGNVSPLKLPLLAAPHYPYSDAVRLTPYVPNAPLGANDTLTTVDGRDYVSTPVSYNALLLFMNPLTTTSSTSLVISMADLNYYKPESYIAGGPVYMEYTYKGERIREVEFILGDTPIPRPLRPKSEISYKVAQGSWSTNSSNGYYPQGKKNQQVKIEVSNSAPSGFVTSNTSLALPMVYKDVVLTLDMPFETTVKEVQYATTAPYKDHPLLTQMAPTKIEYLTFDSLSGTIPVVEGSDKITVPEDIGHVKSLILHYDLWVYNIDNSFILTFDTGTKRENGTNINNNQAVYFIPRFATASNTMVQQYNTPDEQTVPYTQVANSLVLRLAAVEDSLRFGTYGDVSSTFHKGNHFSSIRSYKETPFLSTAGNSLTLNDGKSPWRFAFKQLANQSVDYEDVKIIIEANTEDEKKALSKLAGMQSALRPDTNVSQYDIFIKTNLFPEGKLVDIPVNGIYNVYFDLEDNEYVTYLEMRLGTVYGSSFANGGASYDSGEKIYPSSGYTTPTFRDDRYYFFGTDKQEPISEPETLNLVARIETSSEAKYMDPNSPDYFNSTSTGSITFTPYATAKFKRYETTTPSWSGGNTFYQGSNFNFNLDPSIYYYLNGSTSGSNSYTGMVFPSYDHRLYLEMAEGFELTKIEGYNFVERKPLPDSNTTLFVFETNSSNHGGRIYMTGYVRPDAPVSNNIKIFENLGFDYQQFKDKYLHPDSGPDAYYYSEPYHEVEFMSRPFPATWGITDTIDTQMNVSINSSNMVNVNRSNIDKVVLNAIVDGANQVATANLYDHQKASLAAEGWITNISDSVLPSYRATFNLPRKDKKTQGGQVNGNDTFFTNDYDLYLSGEISYPASLENPEVIYFASDGTEVTPGSSTDWTAVDKVQITFDNFAPRDNVRISLPLETAYEKVGKETKIIKAYVGATSSKRNAVGGEFSEDLYTDPVVYNFLSYSINARIGIDRDEIGQLYSTNNYIGKLSVYYEENGEEKLLYSGSGSSNLIDLNKDATRIEIVPISNNNKLTLQKVAGIPENRNSDFPRDTGSMPIALADLTSRTLYKYDAAFVYVPSLSANDIVVREEESVVTTPKIQTAAIATVVAKYSKVFTVEDPSIATIAQDGTITGVKMGETTYTYTVTNLIGDDFTVTKKITVLKKAVTTASFKKELPDGAINSDDRFKFNIWSKKDKSDLMTIEVGADSSTTDLGGFFLPGTKYFVEETEYDSGYTPKELNISYTTSTGVVEETYPASGTTVTFTVNSDAEKMVMSFVNDSKRYSLKIEKMLLPLNGNHDFTQDFPITVKDNKTNETVLDSSLKGDGTQLDLNELAPNRAYTITEDKTGYELITIEVVNSTGSPTGVTQPIRLDDKSFVLTIDSTHEGAKIIVKNEPDDKGSLRVEYVPDLDFGEIVNGSVQSVLRTQNVYYSVWDSRVVGGNWTLSVEPSTFTTTLGDGSSHTLPYNGLRFSNDGTSTVHLVPDSPVEVKDGTTQNGVPLQTENWVSTDTKGITFQSQKDLTLIGNYESTLTWSIVAAP